MKNIARVLFGFAMLITTTAFAADNKGSMQLMDPAKVGGIQLKPGDYSLQWEATGPDLQLTIKQGNKVKATVPAKLVPLDPAYENDATLINKEDDGTRQVVQIRFAGKKYALQLQPRPMDMNAAMEADKSSTRENGH